MTSKPKKELTEEQQKAVYDAEEMLKRTHNEVRARLAGVGLDIPPEQGGTPCTLCDCETFVVESTGLPGIICSRPTCGHSFFRHDVF
jgi:hypothetical protein